MATNDDRDLNNGKDTSERSIAKGRLGVERHHTKEQPKRRRNREPTSFKQDIETNIQPQVHRPAQLPRHHRQDSHEGVRPQPLPPHTAPPLILT
jgi:hypothetical protein